MWLIILLWIVVGCVIGLIVEDSIWPSRFGLFVNVVVGALGALVGGYVNQQVGFGRFGVILLTILGALLFLLILRWFGRTKQSKPAESAKAETIPSDSSTAGPIAAGAAVTGAVGALAAAAFSDAEASATEANPPPFGLEDALLDMQLPEARLPVVIPPAGELPDVNAALRKAQTAGVSQVDELQAQAEAKLDEMKTGIEAAVPGVQLPDVELPDVNAKLNEIQAGVAGQVAEVKTGIEGQLDDVKTSLEAVLPSGQLPEAQLPDVTLPAVQMPEVNAPTLAAGLGAALGVAGLSVAGGEPAAATLPDIELPDVNAKLAEAQVAVEGQLGKVKTEIETALPNVQLPEVQLPDVTLPNVELPDVNAQLADVQADVQGQVGEWQAGVEGQLSGVKTQLEAALPGVELPDVQLPDVTLLTAELPDVNAKLVEAQTNVAGQLDDVKTSIEGQFADVNIGLAAALPGVQLPEAKRLDVTLPNVELPDVNTQLADVQAGVEGQLGEWQANAASQLADVKTGIEDQLDKVQVGLEAALPSVQLPEAKLLDIELPNVPLPEVNTPTVATGLDAATLETIVPSGQLPGATLTDVTLPKVELLDVSLPEAPAPTVTAGLGAGALGVAGLSLAGNETANTPLPNVELPDAQLTATTVDSPFVSASDEIAEPGDSNTVEGALSGGQLPTWEAAAPHEQPIETKMTSGVTAPIPDSSTTSLFDVGDDISEGWGELAATLPASPVADALALTERAQLVEGEASTADVRPAVPLPDEPSASLAVQGSDGTEVEAVLPEGTPIEIITPNFGSEQNQASHPTPVAEAQTAALPAVPSIPPEPVAVVGAVASVATELPAESCSVAPVTVGVTDESKATPEANSPGANYPDDLTEVLGIGRVYEQKLYQYGIFTFAQLAQTDPELLKQYTDAMDASNVGDWPRQAAKLAKKHKRENAYYNGPMPDKFANIPGISESTEQRLYMLGLFTYEQLAAAAVDQVQMILTPAQRIAEVNVAPWIAKAAELARKKG